MAGIDLRAISLSRSKFQTSEVSEDDIGSKIALITHIFTGKDILEIPPRSCCCNILDLLSLRILLGLSAPNYATEPL